MLELFKELFTGLEEAHGTMGKFKTGDPGEKVKGKARGVHQQVTDELWAAHLSGEQSLGITPINKENKCRWGCIDIDFYDEFDHKKLISDLAAGDIPAMVCKSKSGGAHVFMFTTKPVSASLMQSKLQEIAGNLGYGNSEVFPKQTKILAAKGDMGNWLNLPYFGENGPRVGLSPTTFEVVSLKEFVDLAMVRRISGADLKKLGKIKEPSILKDGPPCLSGLATVGFPEGTRNNGLFSLAVYAKKRYEDTWEDELDRLNRELMDPPLTTREVAAVIKSVKTKGYTYKCKDQPLCNYCNMGQCRTKKYGIGAGGNAPVLTSLTKVGTGPQCMFFGDTSAGRLELSSEELQSQKKFQLRCIEELNCCPSMMKGDDWLAMVNELLSNVSVADFSADAGLDSHFNELLQRFCLDRSSARDINEVTVGKVFTSEEAHVFRLVDLQDYLTKNGFKSYNRSQLCMRLSTDMKGRDTQQRVGGRNTRLWSIPIFEETSFDYELPDMGGNAF